MMDFPEVVNIQRTEGGIILGLYISDELDIFNGHFDAAPIVPGVVQVQWAIEYCNQYLQQLPTQAMERVESLKFQQIIQPESTVTLALMAQEKRMSFSISSNEIRHSSGRIILS